MTIRSSVILAVERADEIVWVGKDLCPFRSRAPLTGGETQGEF